jgi:hypothetical protein
MNQTNSQSNKQHKGGQQTMHRHKPKWLKAILAVGTLAVGMIWMGEHMAYAYTDSISTNNVNALTVRITPNADRGVEISSGNVNLNLGTVDMTVSTYTTSPATVTIVGNMTSAELTLAARILGGWNFDSTPVTAESDKLATWALFSAIAITSAPSANEFEIYNSTIASDSTSQAAAQVGDTTNRYEGGWNGSDMDTMAMYTTRHLWIRMRTPSNTSVTGEQTVSFDLAVEASD